MAMAPIALTGLWVPEGVSEWTTERYLTPGLAWSAGGRLQDRWHRCRDSQLDRFAAELVNEILEPLSEDPGDEIEHLVPRREQTCGGRLEAEDGLALHDDHVVFGAKHVLQEPARTGKELDECRIVVVEDRPGRIAEGLIRDLHRAGGQIQPRPGCRVCHRGKPSPSTPLPSARERGGRSALDLLREELRNLGLHLLGIADGRDLD